MLRISLILSCILLLGNTSCNNGKKNLEVKIWAGDSTDGTINRKQENETLSCFDKKFDDYFCVSSEDLVEIWEALNSCRGNDDQQSKESDSPLF